MFIVDAHCDTLSAMLANKESFGRNSLQIDFETLEKSFPDGYLQFFAAFSSPSYTLNKQKAHINDMLASFNEMISVHGLKKVESGEDLPTGGRNALLALEGLYFMEGDISQIDRMYEQGVRCVSLTWNPDNEFAGGISGGSGMGLTRKGMDLVARCMEKGILVDVSHISDKGFHQTAELSLEYARPFVATHSNSRKLCSHKRNLSDSMLRKLARSGGVTGINMFTCFLNNDCRAGEDDIIRHIEHICSVAGPRHVGLGSDFDGIEREKSAIEGPGGMMHLLERLLSLNYSEVQVRDIAGGNFMRVLRKALL